MTLNTYSADWPAPRANGHINAIVRLPGSKSLTNRELVLAALAAEPTVLVEPLVSRDSELMIAALESLGASFERSADRILVSPIDAAHTAAMPISIHCGLAGTVMRFVPPLAGLHNGQVTFDGDEGARRRPMHTTITSLQALGVSVSDAKALPFTIDGDGEITGGELTIDASESSQFVSGLLLAAPRFTNGLTLTHIGEHLPSMPHIEMTLDCLRKRGVEANQIGSATWRVTHGPISGGEVVIEPDLSNAGPFLAAAMVAGGSVTIPHWPVSTTQVGKEFLGILSTMGAHFEQTSDGLRITSNGKIHGIDIDLSIGGELAPVIAALATLADSPSRIRGIAHLRGHETDRLAALTTEINRVGGDCVETEDGLIITPRPLHGARWLSYDDHRMATAGAIIGLRVPGIEVENIATTAKTMPDFTALWAKMLEV
ncbi:MAG: 3-phosphoshikimate 1-carboxyvinyltransferase, partial [Microbacteriaceae bacterium]